MTEKDRILTLVKEGVITSEEALVLLEQLSDKETKKIIERKEKQVEDVKNLEQQDQANFDKVIESFANVASAFSAKLDENYEDLKQLTAQINSKEERLEELETLRSFEDWDVDEQMEAQRLEEELASLTSQKEALENDKRTMEAEMNRVKKEKIKEELRKAKKQIKETDWKKATDDSARLLGTTIERFARQVSDFVTKTVKNSQDNIEWETREVKVPTIAKTTFEHTFESPATTATIVDVKIANGDLKLKTWNEDYVKVEGKFNFYGTLNGLEPLQALEERSTFTFDEEKITIHIPNKRVYADLLIYLPEREYDYAAFKTLNGDVRIKQLKGKDFYINTTNGDVMMKEVHGTMLETDVLNGDCKLVECEFKDLVHKTLNGDTSVNAAIVSSNITAVSGDVKLHVFSPNTRRIHVTSTNGDVDLNLTPELSFDGILKTSLGDLSYPVEQVEIENETKELTVKKVELKKIQQNSLPILPIEISAQSTTGDLQLNIL